MTRFEAGDRIRFADSFFEANPGLSNRWRNKKGTIKHRINSRKHPDTESYAVIWDGLAKSSVDTVAGNLLVLIDPHIYRGIGEQAAYANGYSDGRKEMSRSVLSIMYELMNEAERQGVTHATIKDLISMHEIVSQSDKSEEVIAAEALAFLKRSAA